MSNTAPVVSWKCDLAAHVERAIQDLLGAFQIAQLHEDLAERRQRDGQAMSGAERLVQAHAAFGKRQRVIVAMPHQHDVRLVVHDSREHVVRGNRHGEAFALTKRRGGFVRPARLREQHRRQRVDEREMTAIAGGVQRGRGFGEVLAHDARIADLLVGEGQLVVREADRARVVRQFGVLERP